MAMPGEAISGHATSHATADPAGANMLERAAAKGMAGADRISSRQRWAHMYLGSHSDASRACPANRSGEALPLLYRRESQGSR